MHIGSYCIVDFDWFSDAFSEHPYFLVKVNEIVDRELIKPSRLAPTCYLRISYENPRQTGRYPTQSYYKWPYTNRNVKGAKWQHKQRHKKFYCTAVADRPRTVGWSNYSHQTGVDNRFTGPPSHIPQQLCNQKDTHIKFENKPPYIYNTPTATPSGEVREIPEMCTSSIQLMRSDSEMVYTS